MTYRVFTLVSLDFPKIKSSRRLKSKLQALGFPDLSCHINLYGCGCATVQPWSPIKTTALNSFSLLLGRLLNIEEIMEHAQTQKLFLVFSLVVTLGLSQPIEESKILAVGWSDWSDIWDDLLDIVTPKTTQCGLSNSPVVIVGVHGGSDAERNEWPWMAMLIENGEQFCDGTIIDEYHVLTAAHCVDW